MDIRAVLDGTVSGDAKSNINHPLAKLVFVILYLGVAIMMIGTRLAKVELPVGKMWLLFWVLFASLSLDFRSGQVPRFMRKLIVISLVAILPLHVQSVVDPNSLLGWVRFVVAYVSWEDMVIFLYGVGAMVAANRLYSLDVLWICNKFPRITREWFIPAMITYFACRRFLAESTREIFAAARFKMRLVRGRGVFKRFATYTGAVATQLLPKFREIVGVIEATLAEREMLGDRRRLSASVYATTEDYIGTITGVCTVAYSFALLVGVA